MSGENDDDLLTVDIGEGDRPGAKDPIEELKEQGGPRARGPRPSRAHRCRRDKNSRAGTP